MSFLSGKSYVSDEEVLIYLIKKIIESNNLNPNDYIKKINDFFRKENITNLEAFLQKSKNIANLLRINEKSLNEYIQKNYFKTVQNLKKEKEILRNAIFNEQTSLISIIVQYIFLHDFSKGKFIEDKSDYVLKLPGRTIYSKIIQSQLNKSEESKIQTPSQSERLTTKVDPKELSVIQEILEKFQFNYISLDLAQKLQTAVENPQDTFNLNANRQTLQQEPQKEKEEEESIILEILRLFPMKVELRLQEIIKNQNGESNVSIENQNGGSSQNKREEQIPFTISDFVEVRKKILYFKNHQKIQEYQDFVAGADSIVKSVIGILNILPLESQPDFSLKKNLEKLSIKTKLSVESLEELYFRIKKYNQLLSYLKQVQEYLKQKNEKYYTYFRQVYEPFLDFLSVYDPTNELNSNESIQRNLKLLLIFIQDENDRQKFEDYLKQIIQRVIVYL
ncbi:MAG: hypothetical protein NZ853_03075 [Leptospiraceae bacterium]|nr:hypothetical protein [Leptospiraceae bacterium]MDW7975157.1 hypothetical protein [Leptospiraceae bacterium]